MWSWFTRYRILTFEVNCSFFSYIIWYDYLLCYFGYNNIIDLSVSFLINCLKSWVSTTFESFDLYLPLKELDHFP